MAEGVRSEQYNSFIVQSAPPLRLFSRTCAASCWRLLGHCGFSVESYDPRFLTHVVLFAENLPGGAATGGYLILAIGLSAIECFFLLGLLAGVYVVAGGSLDRY